MQQAKLILATAPSSKAIASVLDGLGYNGKLVTAGASADAVEVSPLQLIMGKKELGGWASGTAKDSEET